MHQSNTSDAWPIQGCNPEQLLIFKALRVGWWVHQSTSRTPPTCGRSIYAIQNNSLFLGLVRVIDETLPSSHAWTIHVCNPEQLLVFGLFRVGRRDSSEFPRVDDPCMQSRTTTPFKGSSESFGQTLPSSHTWTIHVCNQEELLILRLFRVGWRDSSGFPCVDDPCMQSGTTPCF